MNEIVRHVGAPVRRYDGPLKVTGGAKYAGEFGGEGLLHGYVLSGRPAKGRITSIDLKQAELVPGVVKIFTHENAPKSKAKWEDFQDAIAPPGLPLRPLADDRILFAGQPVALVVAETFEAARYAAKLVSVEYETQDPHTDLLMQQGEAYDPPEKRKGIPPPPAPRGSAREGFDRAPIQVRATFNAPIEHHNPLELQAATAIPRDDGGIKVYDKTQGVHNVCEYLMRVFGLAEGQVEVLSPFMGGGFGSCLRPLYEVDLAVMAALALRKPVRVVLNRTQMYSFGYRPGAIQTVALGADKDGRLQAVIHDAIAGTSTYEDYQEFLVNFTGTLYSCPNVTVTYKLAKLDLATPSDMRAPGATQGVYALEAAMDELAYACKLDPLALRLANYSEEDGSEGKAYTSKQLRAAYSQAAEKFGWSKRSPEPRSMRDGKSLVGWGMATGIWEALGMPTAARAVLTAEGKLTVGNATSDLGTGTYTILQQIAADALGLDLIDVSVVLGDSALPEAPPAGGSWTAASSGSAVMITCEAVKEKLLCFARSAANSPLAHHALSQVEFVGGCIVSKADKALSMSISDAMKAGKTDRIEEVGMFKPDETNQKKFSRFTHSAVFCEVKVDEELGAVRLTRTVVAVAAGRILNPKTARSQIIGGVTFAIGMALTEETMIDHKLGRIMNRNLGEYHVPAHADIHEIDVIFVDEEDSLINPIGVKGLGEIGTVGTAAAIGNAIFHATGKRIRELPITIDKIIS